MFPATDAPVPLPSERTTSASQPDGERQPTLDHVRAIIRAAMKPDPAPSLSSLSRGRRR